MQFFCRLTQFYSVDGFFVDSLGRNWSCLGKRCPLEKSRPIEITRDTRSGGKWISEVWRTVREASSLTANHCHSPSGKTNSRRERKERKKETYCRRWREILIIYLRGTRSDAQPLVVAFGSSSRSFQSILRPLCLEEDSSTRSDTTLILITVIIMQYHLKTVQLQLTKTCNLQSRRLYNTLNNLTYIIIYH